MKKTLLLLFTLIMIGGKAWATVTFDSNKYYYIVEASTGRYAASGVSGSEAYWGLQPAGKMGNKFLFNEVSSGVFTIQDTNGANFGASGWNATNTSTSWTIEEVGDGDSYYLSRLDGLTTKYLNYQTAHPASLYTDRTSKSESDTHKIKFHIVEGLLPADKYVRVSETKANTFTASSGGTNYWYVMTQKKDGESPMYDDVANQAVKRASTSTVVSGSAIDNDIYLVRFVATGTGDSYYVQFANGDYVYSPNPTTQSDPLKSDNRESTATKFMVYKINNENTHIGWNITTDGSAYGKRVDNNGPNSTVVLWDDGLITTTGGNNDWYLYPVTLEDPVTVTYKIVYGAEVLDGFEADKKQLEGEALSVPASLSRHGVTFTYYSDEECATTPITNVDKAVTTVYAKCTSYSLSSLLSADVDHFNWFRLAALSNGVYYDLYYDGTAPYPHKDQSAFDASDGYFWAFIGDPFHGVKVYNKALGSSKTMIHNDNTNPAMGEDDETKWYITILDGRIGFQYTGNTGHRWNDHGGGPAKLKYYGNESWYAYTNIENVDYSALVTANIRPFITNYGSGYFKISETNATSLSTMIDEVDDDGVNLTEYSGLIAALNGMIRWPSTGWYRVKSGSAETYLKAEDANQLTVGGTATDAVTLVYVNGSRGTYTMKMQGKNVTAQANSSPAKLVDGTPTIYFNIPTVSGAVSPGHVSIGTGLTATDYLRVYDGNVIGLAMGSSIADQPTAYWSLEPATYANILLNSDGVGTYYATLCLPFDATISNATAYTLAKSGSWLVPTAVTDNKVPAGTAVLLKGTNETATATINTGDAFGSPLTCALEGTYTNLTVEKTDDVSNDYYLGINNSVVGFYKWDGTTLGANRAYLPKAVAEAAVKGFSIRWADETGVESIEHSPLTIGHEAGTMFDLSGRRVNKAQKGLYIQNGKKVMVK